MFPWATPLETFVQHVISLADPHAGRFDRVESARRVDMPLGGDYLTGGTTNREAHRSSRHRPTARAAGAGPIGAGAPARARPGSPLAWDVEHRLSEVVGPGAAAVRVHTDEAADAFARDHRADAVTVGRDVHFRHGRFRPRDPKGFGLLVHEATHVLGFLRPGSAWRRATGAATEEEDALHAERATLSPPLAARALTSAPSAARAPAQAPSASQPAESPSVAAASGSSAARPMTAAAGRDVDSVQPVPIDLEALRRNLMRDLMGQLRTEFERGG